MDFKIALIRGDGIGPEVVNEAVKVLDRIGEKFGHSFTYTDVLLGGCAIDACGKPYPDGTTEACKACDAGASVQRVYSTFSFTNLTVSSVQSSGGFDFGSPCPWR